MTGRWRVLAALLVAALIPGCDWDIGQFLFHPSVEQRVVESLSMTAPAPAAVDPDSFSFAVFGDVHYTLGAHPALARFRREVEERGIDFCCVLGDLAHDGTAAQLRRAHAGFDSIGVPCYVTNGNHDLFQAEAWPSFKAEFGPSCYAVVIADKVKLLFLDTAEGRLGQRQFEWLEDELASAGDRIKFVGTHFPLYDGGVPGVYRMASGTERAKLQSLLQENLVFAVASGHIHGWRDTRVEGVHHFITGTMQATEDGLDFGKLGYLLVTVAHGSLTWQRIDF